MTKKIEFTDRAKEQIEKIINEDKLKKFFRISVKGGGCSGFKYDFSFEDKKENDDIVFNNILIDENSANLLKGSQVDYITEIIGSSFKITNPQSKSSCGCGESFSV